MIHSMTGYGAASAQTETLRAAVTVRGLNHRFLEVVCHVPRRLAPLEPEIRELVGRRLARGRIEVVVQANGGVGSTTSIVVARPLVDTLVRALRDVQSDFGLEGGVTVSDVIRFPGAVEASDAPAAVEDETRGRVLALMAEALDGLCAMRGAEGGRLREDLLAGLDAIEASTARIEVLSVDGREGKKSSLLEKVRALQGELGLDDARLYQEIARAVERHDVTEEVQRLRSHVAMARGLIGSAEPSGKRLDFLAQELMREANTVGSKSASAALAQEVVGLKSEVERFREQVQNVE